MSSVVKHRWVMELMTKSENQNATDFGMNLRLCRIPTQKKCTVLIMTKSEENPNAHQFRDRHTVRHSLVKFYHGGYFEMFACAYLDGSRKEMEKLPRGAGVSLSKRINEVIIQYLIDMRTIWRVACTSYSNRIKKMHEVKPFVKTDRSPKRRIGCETPLFSFLRVILRYTL